MTVVRTVFIMYTVHRGRAGPGRPGGVLTDYGSRALVGRGLDVT